MNDASPLNDSTPLDDLTLLTTRWGWLVLLALLGGTLGLLASRIARPVYEARAEIVIHLDLGDTNELPEARSSLELSNIAALISANTLGPDLLSAGPSQCAGIPLSDLQIERRETAWTLVVRCPNAQGAATLANNWAAQAMQQLDTAYQHSLRLQILATNISLLSSCNLDPSQAICQEFANSHDLNDRIRSIWEEAALEKEASQGITPNLVFRLSADAQTPTAPVARSSGVLALAGAVIGLLLGWLVATSRLKFHLPARWPRTPRIQ